MGMAEETREATHALAAQFNELCKKYTGPIMPCALACLTYELFNSEHGQMAQNMYEKTLEHLYQEENNGNS